MSAILTHSEKSMLLAIQEDNINEFARRYDNCEFVDKRLLNSEGANFLGECVKRGAVRIAAFLIDRDAELMTLPDGRGNMPIAYLGLVNPKYEMISVFDKAGFDFSLSLGRKGTILHVIAPSATVELFDGLVLKGAGPLEMNERRDKPADIAKRWGNKSLESYILNDLAGSPDFGDEFEM